MQKIFHMIPTMNVGGAETMVKDYALLINKEQFEVKVISLDKSYHSANDRFLEDAGIPVIYLSELRYPGDGQLNLFQKVHRTIGRYIDLRRILKEEKPDVLHVHLHFGNYLKWIPIKKWGIRLFYTVHNIAEHYYDTTGKDRKKYLAYKEIKRLLKKENLILIALHDELKEALCKLFHTNRVITVNNGINLDRFHKELYDKSEIRKSLGISDDTFLVGHIGRFHEQKNHEFIINVYAELRKEKNAHLLLVGGGILKQKIEEYIGSLGLSDKVTILNNRSDIPELLCAMDVFLFPSRWEGAPLSLIEAQSMGTNCIVSDRISNSVIVNNNVTVLSLDTPIEDWVKAILDIKETEVSRDIDKFEIRNIVLCLQEIYQK